MDPSPFLPLTDLAFSILLELEDQELHGYALLKKLRERKGRERLRTGTVYAALSRLQDDGLVEGAGEQAMGPDGDERRKYYRVTPAGSAVARAEAARLDELLELARRKELLPARGS